MSNRGRIRGPRGLLKGTVGTNGYRYVYLVEGGRVITKTLHRLVCAAFHGAPPFEGAMALHRNGNRLDCRATNLYWGTAQDNADDRVRHGRSTRGATNGMSRLTEEQVGGIRVCLALGRSGASIAKEYGVSPTTVSNIKLGRAYAAPQ